MFEDRVLRKVFGTESEEFTGELRKFLCEELRVLNCLPNTISVMTSEMTREGKWIKRSGG